MRNSCRWMALLVIALGAAQAHGAVKAASPAGFLIRIEVPIAAARADAYAHAWEIGRWWSAGSVQDKSDCREGIQQPGWFKGFDAKTLSGKDSQRRRDVQQGTLHNAIS